jgi:hypothetical protein
MQCSLEMIDLNVAPGDESAVTYPLHLIGADVRDLWCCMLIKDFDTQMVRVGLSN